MAVITVFGAICCREQDVIDGIMDKAEIQLITQEDVIRKAGLLSGLSQRKIRDALFSKTSIFNKFTRERERALAYLKLAVAEYLKENQLLMAGMPVSLVPNNISHVLSVCLVGEMDFRMANAKEQGISEKQIREMDKNMAAWVHGIKESEDPWDSKLYDILLPMHNTSTADAAALILDKAKSPAVMYGQESREAAMDFYLAARVEARLVDKGHQMEVACEKGNITLTIHQNVLMLKKLEEEISAIAREVEGVREVETCVGKNFHQSDMYRKFNFTAPSRVLLVDDEREFVQTLSERLLMRDMGAVVTFDGESALNIVEEDAPEVMILDLNMPGIDGMEVLKKVKAQKPEIEVIMLTGHGSETDKKMCMDLGAFAYLHKPVDIAQLSKILQSAHNKISCNSGIPEDGIPEDGIPEDGIPEDGIPEDGIPEDGIPEE